MERWRWRISNVGRWTAQLCVQAAQKQGKSEWLGVCAGIRTDRGRDQCIRIFRVFRDTRTFRALRIARLRKAAIAAE